ncbi:MULTISPECIES: peptide ABC transporter substrate-binding protein [Shouchella]|uniref:Dipeptide-binding protein dppE n=2 Tax=Bacillaceae TaxID=186817 RepID=A0A060M6T1_9BACI|nr:MULTISPECIES: peptide ABC transporter substrate-binding protein [Bacillaceae]AIC95809.1 Dipeptide-binding protein dppE [Shouchella lehensis G1]KQL56669.1 cytochrome C [Alkalicoccobacillus plakortidis]RQW18473.1 peptide ABC transporter substrate-binding protein [Bacillus sp. C1-1]
MQKKWLVGTMAATMMLAACTTGTSNDAEPGGNDNTNDSDGGDKILIVNNGAEPVSLDPQIAFESVSSAPLNNIMEGLMRLNAEHVPEEATAERYEVSEDGLTYTFYLRENANWSNGDPVTAEDFEYAWKRLVDPETGSPAAFLANLIEGATEFYEGEGTEEDVMVTALDEKTLEVVLNSPQQYFLNLITNPSFFPVHKDTVEEDGSWHQEASTYVGNGPFTLTGWDHNTELRMTRNDHYWDAESVALDGATWLMLEDQNTAYSLYEQGGLHTTTPPADLAEELIASGEVDLYDQAGTYFYRFLTTEEPFQNKKIRQAFAKAVDRETIVESVIRQNQRPAGGFVAYGFPEPSGEDFREVGGDLFAYDVEEAQQLLREGMEEEGYETLPNVTISYSSGPAEHERIAESLQQMYAENLEVDVNLEVVESSVFLDRQRGLEMQMSRSSFIADYADPINFLESFITDSSMNRTAWSNETYDQLIADSKAEADEERRFELLHEAEALVLDEMPFFPLYFYNQPVLQHESVSGIVRHPVGYTELKWADLNE